MRRQVAGCQFFQAEFTACKLTGSMFDRCTFALREVSGGGWSFVGLPGADLRGSDISALDPVNTTITRAAIDSSQAILLATALGVRVLPG